MIPTPGDRAAATAIRRAAALHLDQTNADSDGIGAVLADADGEAIGRMLIAQSQLWADLTPVELRPAVAGPRGLLLACAEVEKAEPPR